MSLCRLLKKRVIGITCDPKLNKKREVVTNKVVILEEYISGFDTYVSKVVDSELIAILTRMFKAQAKLS